jgi:negative regulator of flagellin synthesis FlgM
VRKEEVQMSSEAYSEIFKSIALGRSKKFANNVASEVVAKGLRMKDYQKAMEAVAACPDVREDLTAPIKAKIQEGTYKVDASDFADKLMRKYQETRR